MTNTRIETLESMVLIVETIKDYQKWALSLTADIARYRAAGFELDWHIHKRDIQLRVVKRLEQRYKSHLIKLQQL